MNKASCEEKVLSVNSIDESTMVLSNDLAAHINTSRISFDEGLCDLSSDGFITNIDPFQSIAEMMIENGGGEISLEVALGDGEGNRVSFKGAAMCEGEW